MANTETVKEVVEVTQTAEPIVANAVEAIANKDSLVIVGAAVAGAGAMLVIQKFVVPGVIKIGEKAKAKFAKKEEAEVTNESKTEEKK